MNYDLETFGKEETDILLNKKGKGVRRYATKAYGGILPVIFNFGSMWVRGVSFMFLLLYTRQESFRCVWNFSELSVWTIGGTDKSLTTAGTRTTLHRLPQTNPAQHIDYSRIMSTKSQSFCMINSSASLTDLAVLLPQSCEGSCYVVHALIGETRRTTCTWLRALSRLVSSA